MASGRLRVRGSLAAATASEPLFAAAEAKVRAQLAPRLAAALAATTAPGGSSSPAAEAAVEAAVAARAEAALTAAARARDASALRARGRPGWQRAWARHAGTDQQVTNTKTHTLPLHAVVSFGRAIP